MYVTVHQFRRALTRETGDWARAIATGLKDRPRCLGTCTLAQIAGPAGLVVAFWPDRESTVTAAPSGDWTWLDTGLYRVVLTGSAPGTPKFAQTTWFDGPRRQDVAEADLRAARDRIWPAIRHLDGVGDSYAMQTADRAGLVLGFAESVETIEAAQRTIMSTELLPGEDPALLPGPDRVDIHNVLFADLPAPATAGDPR